MWMLVAVVLDTPIETGLSFESLSECLSAEFEAREETADAFNSWQDWAMSNPEVSGYPDSVPFNQFRLGVLTQYLCIPHTAD